AVVGRDVGVAVPAALVLLAAAVDLNEAHAALDQPPGQQALPAEMGAAAVVPAVQAARRPGLPGYFPRFPGRPPHGVGQLKALDAGAQLGIAALLLMPAVEPAQQVELPPLLLRAHVRAAVEVVDRCPLGLEGGALVDARQEACPPVLRVALRQAAAERVVHDD